MDALPVDAPPKLKMDDWLDGLEHDPSNTPAPASRAPAHPPASTPGHAPVTPAPGAVGTVAPHEAATGHPVAGAAGTTGGWLDRWLEQVETHLPGDVEKNATEPSDKDQAASFLAQKADSVERQLDGLLTKAAKLQQQRTTLESLREHLDQIDEPSTPTGAQLDAPQTSRVALETVQEEIDAVHAARADIADAAAKLATDRTTFERFVERVDDFQQRLPELESKMDAVIAKAALADERARQVATLVATSDDLDRQLSRIEDHKRDVETIAAQVDALNSLSDDVDRTLERQRGRRAEVDSLERRLEELSSQIAAARLQTTTWANRFKNDMVDAVQTVEALGQRVAPLTTLMATLEARVERVETGLRAANHQKTETAAQQAGVTEPMAPSAAPAAEVEEASAATPTPEPSPTNGLVPVTVPDVTPGSRPDVSVHIPDLSRPGKPVLVVTPATPRSPRAVPEQTGNGVVPEASTSGPVRRGYPAWSVSARRPRASRALVTPRLLRNA